jgi:hypothetical protein
MVRELTVNRWNWSQEHQKWVFIEINSEGKKIHHFQAEPPKEFNELIFQIKILNDKLLLCCNAEENDRIFNKMMKVSKRMQCMGRK